MVSFAGFSFVADAEGGEFDTGMIPIVPGWLGPEEQWLVPREDVVEEEEPDGKAS